eukprot:scaffold59880_cov24-Tisochrysis_lutea.AAC.1
MCYADQKGTARLGGWTWGPARMALQGCTRPCKDGPARMHEALQGWSCKDGPARMALQGCRRPSISLQSKCSTDRYMVSGCARMHVPLILDITLNRVWNVPPRRQCLRVLDSTLHSRTAASAAV